MIILLNADYIDYFCIDILVIDLKIRIMNYENFANAAQPWMKVVCHELFEGDIFSPSSQFDFLFDYDFESNLVHGFRIMTPFPLSMGDFVHMNQVCSKNGCFYVCRSGINYCLSVSFLLENYG